MEPEPRAPRRRRSALQSGAWLLAGALLALPFHANALEPLALLTPIPWLLLAAVTPRLRFRVAWLGGAAFVAVGLAWLNVVHPLALLTCALYFGAYPAGGAWACSRLASAGIPLVIAAPACVLAYETLVQRFAVFESTFLAFGALTWRVPSITQVASIGGISLISAAAWALPAGLCDAALLIRREGWPALRRPRGFLPPLLGALALPLCALAGTALMPRLEPAPLMRVALVQGNVPQSVRNRTDQGDAIIGKHAELTARLVPRGMDLVAWPESTASLALEQDEEAVAFLGLLSQRIGAPILIGAIGLNDKQDSPSNSAFLVSGDGLGGRCDKRCLVPGAETLLVIDGIPRARRAIGDFLSRTMHFRPFLKAGRLPVVMTTAGVRFGALICYDDIVAVPSEELRAAGAQALVTITNEAWFGRAELRQHLALAVFRCVETRLPMARCGNDGLTCLIDPAGRVTQSLPEREEGVLVGSLAWTKASPVPRIVRTLVAWTSVALVVAMLIAIRIRKGSS